MIVEITTHTMNPYNFLNIFCFVPKSQIKIFSGNKNKNKKYFSLIFVQTTGCLRSYSIQVPLIHTGQGFLGYLWVYSVLEDNVSFLSVLFCFYVCCLIICIIYVVMIYYFDLRCLLHYFQEKILFNLIQFNSRLSLSQGLYRKIYPF